MSTTPDLAATKAAPGGRTVAKYLTDDHDRLDAILTEVQTAVRTSAFAPAETRFAEFEDGLGRHIDAEERVLFPFFEHVSGMVGRGPTVVMRNEHVTIRDLMNRVRGALAAADAERAHEFILRLMDLLANHNMKEERVLYPMTDEAAGCDGARHELVARLQSIAPGRVNGR